MVVVEEAEGLVLDEILVLAVTGEKDISSVTAVHAVGPRASDYLLPDDEAARPPTRPSSSSGTQRQTAPRQRPTSSRRRRPASGGVERRPSNSRPVHGSAHSLPFLTGAAAAGRVSSLVFPGAESAGEIAREIALCAGNFFPAGLGSSLAVLDLSDGGMESLPVGMGTVLPGLRVLALGGNVIRGLGGMIAAMEGMDALEWFVGAGNPVALHPDYRQAVANACPSMLAVDFHLVADEEIIDGLSPAVPIPERFRALGDALRVPQDSRRMLWSLGTGNGSNQGNEGEGEGESETKTKAKAKAIDGVPRPGKVSPADRILGPIHVLRSRVSPVAVLQRCARGWLARSRARGLKSRQVEAARTVQFAWLRRRVWARHLPPSMLWLLVPGKESPAERSWRLSVAYLGLHTAAVKIQRAARTRHPELAPPGVRVDVPATRLERRRRSAARAIQRRLRYYLGIVHGMKEACRARGDAYLYYEPSWERVVVKAVERARRALERDSARDNDADQPIGGGGGGGDDRTGTKGVFTAYTNHRIVSRPRRWSTLPYALALGDVLTPGLIVREAHFNRDVRSLYEMHALRTGSTGTIARRVHGVSALEPRPEGEDPLPGASALASRFYADLRKYAYDLEPRQMGISTRERLDVTHPRDEETWYLRRVYVGVTLMPKVLLALAGYAHERNKGLHTRSVFYPVPQSHITRVTAAVVIQSTWRSWHTRARMTAASMCRCGSASNCPLQRFAGVDACVSLLRASAVLRTVPKAIIARRRAKFLRGLRTLLAGIGPHRKLGGANGGGGGDDDGDGSRVAKFTSSPSGRELYLLPRHYAWLAGLGPHEPPGGPVAFPEQGIGVNVVRVPDRITGGLGGGGGGSGGVGSDSGAHGSLASGVIGAVQVQVVASRAGAYNALPLWPNWRVPVVHRDRLDAGLERRGDTRLISLLRVGVEDVRMPESTGRDRGGSSQNADVADGTAGLVRVRFVSAADARIRAALLYACTYGRDGPTVRLYTEEMMGAYETALILEGGLLEQAPGGIGTGIGGDGTGTGGDGTAAVARSIPGDRQHHHHHHHRRGIDSSISSTISDTLPELYNFAGRDVVAASRFRDGDEEADTWLASERGGSFALCGRRPAQMTDPGDQTRERPSADAMRGLHVSSRRSHRVGAVSEASTPRTPAGNSGSNGNNNDNNSNNNVATARVSTIPQIAAEGGDDTTVPVLTPKRAGNSDFVDSARSDGDLGLIAGALAISGHTPRPPTATAMAALRQHRRNAYAMGVRQAQREIGHYINATRANETNPTLPRSHHEHHQQHHRHGHGGDHLATSDRDYDETYDDNDAKGGAIDRHHLPTVAVPDHHHHQQTQFPTDTATAHDRVERIRTERIRSRSAVESIRLRSIRESMASNRAWKESRKEETERVKREREREKGRNADRVRRAKLDHARKKQSVTLAADFARHQCLIAKALVEAEVREVREKEKGEAFRAAQRKRAEELERREAIRKVREERVLQAMRDVAASRAGHRGDTVNAYADELRDLEAKRQRTVALKHWERETLRAMSDPSGAHWSGDVTRGRFVIDADTEHGGDGPPGFPHAPHRPPTRGLTPGADASESAAGIADMISTSPDLRRHLDLPPGSPPAAVSLASSRLRGMTLIKGPTDVSPPPSASGKRRSGSAGAPVDHVRRNITIPRIPPVAGGSASAIRLRPQSRA